MSEATGYRVQLDQKEVESYDLTGLLQEATSYSWRMCTLNEAGACGFWATASFTTETTPPGPPTLLLPSPDADAVALLPLFEWDASGAETYELQLTPRHRASPHRGCSTSAGSPRHSTPWALRR